MPEDDRTFARYRWRARILPSRRFSWRCPRDATARRVSRLDSPPYPAPIGHGARLDALLNELMRRVPELEAAAVVTADGLPMSSALPPGMDEDRVAAMSAALLSLGERAAEGLGRGELSQVHIQGEYGGVWLLAAGDDAVLVGVSAADAKAGLVLYELRRATAAVEHRARCRRARRVRRADGPRRDAAPPPASSQPRRQQPARASVPVPQRRSAVAASLPVARPASLARCSGD